MIRTSSIYVLAFVALATAALSGCTPRISPLYRDYRIADNSPNSMTMHERISVALEQAGWSVVDGATANVVATESRKFRTYGIYSMEVELEVSPVGDHFVRVFIHPYRRYFTGSRGKLPYLKKGLAKSVMKTLEEPFEEQGLRFAGTAQSRDEARRRSNG